MKITAALTLSLTLIASPALADPDTALVSIAGQIVAKEVCNLPYLRETMAHSVRELQAAGMTPEQIMDGADFIATYQANKLQSEGLLDDFCRGMERMHAWER